MSTCLFSKEDMKLGEKEQAYVSIMAFLDMEGSTTFVCGTQGCRRPSIHVLSVFVYVVRVVITPLPPLRAKRPGGSGRHKVIVFLLCDLLRG